MPRKKKKYNARFPPARIKKIMQLDEDVGKVAAAVPVLISKALEIFVESLLTKSLQQTRARSAKTMSTSHIKQCIQSENTFDFLKDLVENVPDMPCEEDDVCAPMVAQPSERKHKQLRSMQNTASIQHLMGTRMKDVCCILIVPTASQGGNVRMKSQGPAIAEWQSSLQRNHHPQRMKVTQKMRKEHIHVTVIIMGYRRIPKLHQHLEQCRFPVQQGCLDYLPWELSPSLVCLYPAWESFKLQYHLRTRSKLGWVCTDLPRITPLTTMRTMTRSIVCIWFSLFHSLF